MNTPIGRESGGQSNHLELKHPGYFGANPHGLPALPRPPAKGAGVPPLALDSLGADPRAVASASRVEDVETASAPAPAPARRARSARSRALLIVRRTHLVLGLLLLPFVALYGATAVLFNHATWAGDVAIEPLDARALQGAEFLALSSDPESTARALLPAGAPIREARWEGSWQFETRANGRVVRADVDPAGRGGRRIEFAEEATALTGRAAKVDAATLEGWEGFASLAAGAAPFLALDPEAVVQKRAPRLVVRTADGDRPVLVRWDPANGALSARVDDGRDPVEFLKRLHVAHGTAGFVDARWWWAVVVDLMGFAMLAWAASGVVLWWSIRAVRRLGTVVLVVSAVITIALVAGMHGALPR